MKATQAAAAAAGGTTVDLKRTTERKKHIEPSFHLRATGTERSFEMIRFLMPTVHACRYIRKKKKKKE